MDQKLLDALNNLSDALQLISDALGDKKGAKAPTAQALQSGDFSKQIVQINAGIKSIKKDTQEILKQQKTILGISQKKEADKNTGLSDEMGDKKSGRNLKKASTAQALQSGDFSKQIVQINAGIKSIKKDTQNILKQQKTILAISQKKEADKKMGLFGDGGDKKSESNLKKGIGIIVLIAVAVLAIGLAFKIVGNVDFLSVVGLGIAIVLISVAFEKVAKLNITTARAIQTSKVLVIIAAAVMLSSIALSFIKPLSFAQLITATFVALTFAVLSKYLTQMFLAVILFDRLKISPIKLSIVLVSIAAAITASSYVLSLIKPLSFAQSITAILIAAMFAVISINMEKIALGVLVFERLRVGPMALVKTLLGMSAAITASSYILALLRPLSFAQSITAILIAAMFAVISFNMEKIVMGVLAFERLRVSPIALVKTLLGISAAITASSWILSLIKPLSLFQFLTAIGIAVMFAVISYVMDKLAVGIILMEKFLGAGKLFLIPLVFVAISLAITLSSHILDKAVAIDLMKLLKIGLLGIALAFVTLAMLPAIVLVGLAVMSGIGAGALLAGLAIMPLVAMALMLSSHILALGEYSKFPSFSWAMGVGASMLGFSVSMIALGALVMTGIGAVALGLGAVAVLGVATTIVTTAEILSKGDFSKYPSLGWAVGVGLLITSFGLATMALGVFILGTFGLGGLALKKGSEAIKNIAQSIVDTAAILGRGNFSGGPTKAWAEGVSLAIGAFAPVYGMLMVGGIMKLFGGGASPEDFSTAIKTISEGILYSATLFVGTEGIFQGGPTKAWSEGVGTAISAFAPVFKILMADGVLKIFGGGIDVNSMKSAIMTISQGIVDAAVFFKGKGDLFSDGSYPSETWGKNVGLALSAFSPVYEAIAGKSWYQSSGGAVASLTEGVRSMADAIVSVATSFSSPDVSWTSYPDKSWVVGVAGAVKSYVVMNDYLADKKYDDSVVRIARKLSNVAQIMSKTQFVSRIDPNFMKNMQSNVFYYIELTKKLNNSSGGLSGLVKGSLFGDPITNVANSMIKLANAYDRMSNSLTKFGKALGTIDASKVNTFKNLNNGILSTDANSGIDGFVNNFGSAVGSVVGGIGSVVGGLVNSVKNLFGGDKSAPNANVNSTPGTVGRYGDSAKQMDAVIELLTKLNESTKSLDLYIKERMSNGDGKSAMNEK